jgi:hypothetical protein
VRARFAATIVLAIGVALGTAGCNLVAPEGTLSHYDASDGVSGTVGNLDVRNAILISDTGTQANLLVTFVNNGATDIKVKVQHGTNVKKTVIVDVPAGKVKKIGDEGQTHVQFADINTPPGSMSNVYFQYGARAGVNLLVPVLTNAMSEYREATPTPVITPRPTLSGTPAPLTSVTPTPAP